MQDTSKEKRKSRSVTGTVGPERDDLARLTAKRIISAYGGVPALKELHEMFEKQISGPEIAKRFDVTRQRVSQWRAALGHEQCVFSLRDCVRQVLKDAEKAAA